MNIRTQIVIVIALLGCLVSNSLYAQTESAIKLVDLPAQISISIQKDYKKYRITETYLLLSADEETSYRVVVLKKKKEYYLMYNKDGILSEKIRVYSFGGPAQHQAQPRPANDGHNHQH